MKNLIILAVSSTLTIATFPVFAFECTNNGAAADANPDDSGDKSALACGDGATAANESVALGVGATASSAASASIAIGKNASASGVSSSAVALGDRSQAADSGVAVGLQAEALDGTAVAFGTGATAAGFGDIAIGEDTSAGDGSTLDNLAIGFEAVADGGNALAHGAQAMATGEGSVALGYRAMTAQDYAITFGAPAGESIPFSKIGAGTSTPTSALHIFRDNDEQGLMLLESNEVGVVQDRAMMQLSNNGGIRFQFDNNAQGTAWRFQTATGQDDQFEVTKVGTGQIELALDAAGNLQIQGTLTEMSDRDAKTGVRKLDNEAILEALTALDVSEWSYIDTPEARHIGPMAQDFHAAFGLGKDERHLSARDLAGVAVAAIKALDQRNGQLEEKNRTLQADLQNLQKQVALLTSAVLGQEESLSQR